MNVTIETVALVIIASIVIFFMSVLAWAKRGGETNFAIALAFIGTLVLLILTIVFSLAV